MGNEHAEKSVSLSQLKVSQKYQIKNINMVAQVSVKFADNSNDLWQYCNA